MASLAPAPIDAARAAEPTPPAKRGAASTRVDHAHNGLEISRTWEIRRRDRRRLVATIVLENPTDSAIQVVHAEPIPTDSAESVKARTSTGTAAVAPGILRFTTSVPSRSSVELGYTILLRRRNQQASAKATLADVENEMDRARTAATADPPMSTGPRTGRRTSGR